MTLPPLAKVFRPSFGADAAAPLVVSAARCADGTDFAVSTRGTPAFALTPPRDADPQELFLGPNKYFHALNPYENNC